MHRYAVMGNPIQHSLSPRIHQLFAEQVQLPLIYESICVPLGGLAQALDDFEAQQGRGLNITAPFKQTAYALVDQVSARAERAKGINTICFLPDGRRLGDNTDGVGLMRDLMQNQHYAVQGKRILILGAGGAARGILGPLLDAGPQSVWIANRTVAKAQQLAAEFAGFSPLEGVSLSEIPMQPFDFIINSTSASMQGEALPLPDHLIAPATVCYDLSYVAQGDTPFIQRLKAQGARQCHSGLGMLIEQAAESFYLWHHVRPNTAISL